MGTIRFGNDHVAAIKGYGDYQIGNVTISRVYYVEGLSHRNFSYINELAKKGLVRGLPKLKYQKDHLCIVCSLGKSKKHTHKPKSDDPIQEKLYLLHMDLCATMRIESINGKNYILVIVDDYSRFTWHLTPNFSCAYSITERRFKRWHRALVEDARTMLIFSKAPLFLWVEAVTTACYTQNHSLIQRCHNKTPYELIHDKKPNLTYFHVFGALYPTNDGEDTGKLKPKADIGIFVGYAPAKNAYQIYNRRTQLIQETIHVEFDVLTAMASEQFSSGPELQVMTPRTISLGLMENPPSTTPYVQTTKNDCDLLFQPMFDEYLNPPPIVVSPVNVAPALRPADPTGLPSSTSID
uniref:Integrase, catalytic region, zinc finger, CCHC-type, peptidase aspartic, catalytic n=1 Tax=Tanacetum cinerariifolium TaxID=118510 RepID=A0A699H2R2_TANCI|nr:hypothetical protein [Tanacetum cinerariifolium]